MKRLSNGRSSSRTRSAGVIQDSYEPEDTEITTQRVKFGSLYQEDDDDTVAVVVEKEEVLRKKHRKTWRISSIKNGANNQQQQEMFLCSKCGKGFQSLKAKCGHMAYHSGKEKAPSRNLFAKKKLAMDDNQSDTESGHQRLMRRSRRKRNMMHNSVSAVGSKAKVVNANKNCSSEDSGVEQEQEEVAISLMMLSRDSANWGGLNSVDSSDNNSVVLEARSFSTKMAQKGGLSTELRVDEPWKKFGNKEVTSLGDSKTEPHLSLNKLKGVMDAGVIRYGEGDDQTVRPNMDLYMKKRVLNEPYIAGYYAGYHQFSNSEMYQQYEHKAHIHSQSQQAYNAGRGSHCSFKQNGTQLHDFIDLNLPAPMEDDQASESMGSYR